MKVGEAVLNKRSKVHKFALKICTVCHILFVVFLVVFFFLVGFFVRVDTQQAIVCMC